MPSLIGLTHTQNARCEAYQAYPWEDWLQQRDSLGRQKEYVA